MSKKPWEIRKPVGWAIFADAARKHGVIDVGALIDELDSTLLPRENAGLFRKALAKREIAEKPEVMSDLEHELSYIDYLIDELGKRDIEVIKPEERERIDELFNLSINHDRLRKENEELKSKLEEALRAEEITKETYEEKMKELEQREKDLKEWEEKVTSLQFKYPKLSTPEKEREIKETKEEIPEPSLTCPDHPETKLKDIRDLTESEIQELFESPVTVAPWAEVYICPEDNKLYERFRNKLTETRPDILSRKRAVRMIVARPEWIAGEVRKPPPFPKAPERPKRIPPPAGLPPGKYYIAPEEKPPEEKEPEVYMLPEEAEVFGDPDWKEFIEKYLKSYDEPYEETVANYWSFPMDRRKQLVKSFKAWKARGKILS
jgi:hypothetical protein